MMVATLVHEDIVRRACALVDGLYHPQFDQEVQCAEYGHAAHLRRYGAHLCRQIIGADVSTAFH